MPSSAFEFFVGRNNARVVELLDRNEDVAAFTQGLLERIVEYCGNRGLRFDQVTVESPVVSDDGYVQFRIR